MPIPPVGPGPGERPCDERCSWLDRGHRQEITSLALGVSAGPKVPDPEVRVSLVPRSVSRDVRVHIPKSPRAWPPSESSTGRGRGSDGHSNHFGGAGSGIEPPALVDGRDLDPGRAG